MKGAAPQGARNEREAAAWVRGMFARVARRYDLANHLLSFNIDRLWRARTVRRVRPILERPGARVLDICCGTGDLTLALARECRAPVLGSDFCHPMLRRRARESARRRARAGLFEADALRLPLRDASLDLVTVAFGFRNLANYRAGLAEMRRVLRPGGMAAILEFSATAQPRLRRALPLLFPPHPSADRRRALRLARCLHVSPGIRSQVSLGLRNWRKRCAAPASRRCVTNASPAALWLCTWESHHHRSRPL